MGLDSNLSAKARELDLLGKAVFTDVGEAIRDGLEPSFVQLVNETAQYTGTTAASWNITIGGVGDGGGVRLQPERSRASALRMGHQAAVNIAITANQGNLDSLVNWIKPGQKGHKPGAIMVENYSPNAEIAEYGPLRDVNAGAEGAFSRFLARATDILMVVKDRQV